MTTMTRRSRFYGGVVCAVSALLVATIASWPRIVQALDSQQEAPAFGMVGLARAQTARLNLVNLQPPDPAQPPDPGQPPDPALVCSAHLTFLDGSAAPFHNASGMPIGADVRLGPAQAAFVDLRSGDVFRDSPLMRAQFRGVVEYPPVPISPDPCARAVATLEIFDNFTGRTMVLYAIPAVPISPSQEETTR